MYKRDCPVGGTCDLGLGVILYLNLPLLSSVCVFLDLWWLLEAPPSNGAPSAVTLPLLELEHSVCRHTPGCWRLAFPVSSHAAQETPVVVLFVFPDPSCEDLRPDLR